jgi:selenide,water dikinase
VTAVVHAGAVPVFPAVWSLIELGCVPGGSRRNLDAAEAWTRFDPEVTPAQRLVLADAQTSGGLLLCVPPRHLDAVLACLRQRRTLAATIVGQITTGRSPSIRVGA